MPIEVRYFASLRELTGRKSETIELEPGTTVQAVMTRIAGDDPRLQRAVRACLPMVNMEYVSRDHQLIEGDELALIPPVSGGTSTVGGHFAVTEDVLDPREVERMVAAPSAGAVALFIGTVRDHARGQDVQRLEYEAYAPAAEKMLARIGDEIAERWKVERVAIVHRTGMLEVGEASVVIGVSSPHRAEAFDACRHAIERIKEIVPIWKKEFYADGSAWIGSEADYQRETGRLTTR